MFKQELIICKRCNEYRVKGMFRDGVCIICHSADRDMKNDDSDKWKEVARYPKYGVWVDSKTGRIDENLEFGKSR